MNSDRPVSGGLPAARALPWPLAAFGGLAGGALLAWGSPWGALALLAPLGFWRAGRGWPLLVCALAFGLLGAARERAWEAEPDRLAPWRGAVVTLSGRWDGQFLTLADPPARVALSPAPSRAGDVRVQGRLVDPPGRRNPGGFDYALWLRASGVRHVLAGAQVLETREEGGARGWFRRGLRAGLAPREAALMEAIGLGDRREVADQDVGSGLRAREAFARAGLAHLMALSGQNVALLVAALTVLLARTPLAPLRYPLLLGGLAAYLALVGASPSVLRAVLQAAAMLVGLWAGRGRLDPLGALGLAGTASLLAFPAWVFDVGFQLSFLAVAGLSLTPRVEARLPARWPRALRVAVAGTLLAEAATLPVVAHGFGQVPLVGLPANLLAAPLMALLVPLGFLAGALGPLGAVPNLLVGPLAKALLALVGLFGAAPVLPWGALGAGGAAAYGVFALGGAAWLRRRLRARHLALVALACLAATGLPPRLWPAREVVFLDVGQGDATLVRLGDFAVLIDGGGTPRGDYDVGARTVVPALRALGVFDLELVIATHADADHIEGLPSVLRAMPVGEVWLGHRKTEDPLVAAVLDAARERGVPVREVRRGDAVSAGGATLMVLWPPPGPPAEADNENSVALRLDAGGWRAAFLGDLAAGQEERLGMGRLDLLKIAHHGSRHSTSAAFLRETRPPDAVVSVGRNTYGHPDGAVLERLRAAGARVWRTDGAGAVRWPVPTSRPSPDAR